MKNKGTLIGIVLFIIALGVGGFFMFGKKKDTGDGNDNQNGNDLDTGSSEIDLMVEEIKNKPALLAKIKQKAIDRGISTEEMLRLDAAWIIKHKK